MKIELSLNRREPIQTVSVVSQSNAAALSEAMTRLRSWALIRGVPVEGEAFVQFAGPAITRVHLPVGEPPAPHPDTGVSLDRVPGGVIVLAAGVALADGPQTARALEDLFANEAPVSGRAELHPGPGEAFEGTLVLPLVRAPVRPIEAIALELGRRGPGAEKRLSAVRVVTVARQAGTGGDEIASRVASILGWRPIGREVLGEAARSAGVTPEVLAANTRRKSFIERALESMAYRPPEFGEAWTPPLVSQAAPHYTSADYRRFIEEVILDVAHEGNAVIIGHGAQLLLAGQDDALRVLVTGSLSRRAERLAAEQGITVEKARTLALESDRERVQYFHEFYQSGWLDPCSYDLSINSDHLDAIAAARLIAEIVDSTRLPPAERAGERQLAHSR